MKRRDLIRELRKIGCVLIRHGGNHDWYQNPNTRVSQPVPRHREIKDVLAKQILKILRD
ncbi:MAG: type II toxin-antitoxin system HicA family toxin [Candidatus Poribacteria bacterium]|nr:type II toxin-antitoxin system HicA family toxin [Candidatus Poribacteria bacterium]